MAREVRGLMADAVILAAPGDTVGEARDLLSQHDISALPVVDADGVLLGIVTSEDLMAEYEATLPVTRVMSAPVDTLAPDTDVREAARRMRTERYHHLVVVEHDRVVGVLSTFDLLRLLEVHAG